MISTEHIKVVGDSISLVTVSAALMNILPPIAALLTVIWTAIRLYETRTIQKWLKGKSPKTRSEDRKSKHED